MDPYGMKSTFSQKLKWYVSGRDGSDFPLHTKISVSFQRALNVFLPHKNSIYIFCGECQIKGIDGPVTTDKMTCGNCGSVNVMEYYPVRQRRGPLTKQNQAKLNWQKRKDDFQIKKLKINNC